MTAAGGGFTLLRVAGGRPTTEEIAALVVALDAAARQAPAPEPPPAWLRAARVEALGQRLVSAPGDLRAVTR